MGAAFLITLREGMEAALVLSIILAYLNAVGRPERQGAVWAGAITAAAASIVAAVVVFVTAGSLSATAREAFEGVVAFLAVSVLTWMIFWMRRQARYLKADLQERVDVALASGSALALPLLAFFVVVREGFETVLFLFATFRATAAESALLGIAGGILGLGVAAILGILVYRGGSRLNLRTFFKATGALILLVAAGLVANGIHEFQEIGWFPIGTGTAFDIRGVLPDSGPGLPLRAMFGYNANPTWLELAGWATYLVVTGFLFFRPAALIRVPARAGQAGS